MKIAGIVALSILLIFIGVNIYHFWSQDRQLSAQLSSIESRLTQSQTEETDMQSDVQYLANPANLEKEIRTRFNYKKPGETMIIIVPNQSSTSSTGE